MITSKVPTINEPRDFLDHELFFSITNPQGCILFGNETFTRISAYEEVELINKPHSTIRHPDMPRGVFNLFWEYLKKEKTIAAYVKNLAKDGRYYWVMAVGLPCKGGYLSVRLKPTSPLFEKAKELYADTLKMEAEVEKVEGKKEAAIQSQEYMLNKLKELGFESYDKFMSEALSQELTSRSKKIAHLEQENHSETHHNATIQTQQFSELEQVSGKVSNLFSNVFKSLDVFHQISNELPSKREKMADLGPTLSLLALNTHISASRMGDAGATLSVTSHAIRSLSKDADRLIKALLEHIESLCTAAESLEFNVAVATLESEISTNFATELIGVADEERDPEIGKWIETILLEMSTRGQGVFDELNGLLSLIRSLASDAEKLARQVRQIRVAQLNGRIEIAAVDCENNYDSIFAEIESVVNDALFECAEILKLLSSTDASVRKVLLSEQGLNKNLGQLDEITERIKEAKELAMA